MCGTDANDLECWYRDGDKPNDEYEVRANNLNVSEWYLITFDWDISSSARLYVNGIQEDTTSLTGNQFDNGTIIYTAFGRSATGDRFFNGTVDEIAVFNRILPSADIDTTFAEQNGSNTSILNLSFDLNLLYIYLNLDVTGTQQEDLAAAVVYVTFNDTNVTGDDVVHVGFNFSDGANPSPQLNSTKITIAFVASDGEAPVIANASTNLTASSVFTADTFNSTLNIHHPDEGNKTNLTLVLFIDDVVNQTVELHNDYVTGTNFSFIFTDVNFSISQTVIVQFNGSDSANATDYLNSTEITILDIPSDGGVPVVGSNSINLTNSTLFTGDTFNGTTFITHPDAGNTTNLTLVFFVDGVVNQTVELHNDYVTDTNVSFSWNNTNFTKFQEIVVQANSSDNANASNYLNSLFLRWRVLILI